MKKKHIFFILSAILIFFCCFDIFLTIYESHSIKSKREKEIEKYHEFLYFSLIEHLENSENSFQIPEKFRFSPIIEYQTKKTVKIPLAFSIEVQSRENDEWIKISDDFSPAIPVIFPFSFYPCDVFADDPNKSFIIFSDGTMNYDFNPMLCEIHLTNTISTSLGITGEYLIIISENDNRFEFAHKFKALKALLPVPIGYSVDQGFPEPIPVPAQRMTEEQKTGKEAKQSRNWFDDCGNVISLPGYHSGWPQPDWWQ